MLQAKLNKVFSTDGFTLGLVVQTGDRYLKRPPGRDLGGASFGTTLWRVRRYCALCYLVRACTVTIDINYSPYAWKKDISVESSKYQTFTCGRFLDTWTRPRASTYEPGWPGWPGFIRDLTLPPSPLQKLWCVHIRERVGTVTEISVSGLEILPYEHFIPVSGRKIIQSWIFVIERTLPSF